MLNFDFLENSLELVFPPYFVICFTGKIILVIFCYFRYWGIYLLQLFVLQIVMSLILKLTLAYLSSRFNALQKKSGQKFKDLRVDL